MCGGGGGGRRSYIVPQCVLADMHSEEQMHVAFNSHTHTPQKRGGGGLAVSKQGAKRPQKPQGLLGTGKMLGGGKKKQ